jgi:hypothetical protein
VARFCAISSTQEAHRRTRPIGTGNESVHDAKLRGPRGVDRLPSEHHFQSHRGTHQTWQALRAAGSGISASLISGKPILASSVAHR